MGSGTQFRTMKIPSLFIGPFLEEVSLSQKDAGRQCGERWAKDANRPSVNRLFKHLDDQGDAGLFGGELPVSLTRAGWLAVAVLGGPTKAGEKDSKGFWRMVRMNGGAQEGDDATDEFLDGFLDGVRSTINPNPMKPR